MAGDVGRTGKDDEPDGWTARDIARRNRDPAGKPLSQVMKTAATAAELAHGARGREPREDGS